MIWRPGFPPILCKVSRHRRLARRSPGPTSGCLHRHAEHGRRAGRLAWGTTPGGHGRMDVGPLLVNSAVDRRCSGFSASSSRSMFVRLHSNRVQTDSTPTPVSPRDRGVPILPPPLPARRLFPVRRNRPLRHRITPDTPRKQEGQSSWGSKGCIFPSPRLRTGWRYGTRGSRGRTSTVSVTESPTTVDRDFSGRPSSHSKCATVAHFRWSRVPGVLAGAHAPFDPSVRKLCRHRPIALAGARQ